MRVYLIFLLLLILLFTSCSEDKNTLQYEHAHADSYLKDTLKINTFIRQVANRDFENTNTAINLLDFAENLSAEIGYDEGLAKSLYLKGNIYYLQNKYKLALDCYNRSLEVAKKSNNILLNAQCLERIASVYLTIGDDHLALKLYYEALPLFEQISNKEGIAKVYNIIGVSKTSQGEYDTAVNYFGKAMKLNEEIGNLTGLIHNNGNLAFMYHRMGNTEKAKEVYISLVPKLIETHDSINLSVVFYHLSMFCESLSQPDSTLYYLYQARSVSEKIADTSLLVTLYGKIGKIYLDHRQYDSAYILLTKSAEMSKNIEDYVTQKQALKLLISIDTIKGNFKRVAERYKKIIIAGDSVYNQKLRNNLEASELAYENQKKSNLIEIQRLELASASRQKQFLLFIFVFSVLTSLLLIILFISHRRSYKRKKEVLAEKLKINELQLENIKQTEEINNLRIEKIEREIKIKENEQVSHALAMEQKNQLLSMINKKFTEAMQDKGSISLAELNGLVSTIKTQVKDSVDTDLFNQKFNQLHNNFFNDLKQSHPDLTKSELKFCAYLKLNLTGNQIASILNVTPEAIRKTRYRIRKKLNLSTTDSLEDYISRF
jgi:tetratricopeptide (TPR) repeat protein